MSSTTPKFDAKCPPTLETAPMICSRISWHSAGNRSGDSRFRSAGLWIFFKMDMDALLRLSTIKTLTAFGRNTLPLLDDLRANFCGVSHKNHMKSSTYGRHTVLRNHSYCPWHELCRSLRPRPAPSEQDATRSLNLKLPRVQRFRRLHQINVSDCAASPTGRNLAGCHIEHPTGYPKSTSGTLSSHPSRSRKSLIPAY